MRASLVIGAGGYVGGCYSDHLAAAGFPAVRAGRRPGPGVETLIRSSSDLDALLEAHEPSQVVVTAQLRDSASGWVLDRIDGPRWVVLSSAQLASRVPAPGHERARLHEDLARLRGAVVLRPTMIFGRDLDLNVSRLIRQIERFRFAVQIGGEQLVQPIHVDDLSALLARHLLTPHTRRGGALVEVGGSEQLSVAELLDDLEQLVGAAGPRVRLPTSTIAAVSRLARAMGLRADQVERLVEDKIVDVGPAQRMFGWQPHPLAVRLEQAYRETRVAATQRTSSRQQPPR
jgi:uncharacterized protein YbjT (DUF2867 family)